MTKFIIGLLLCFVGGYTIGMAVTPYNIWLAVLGIFVLQAGTAVLSFSIKTN